MIEAKQQHLKTYFDSCKNNLSGVKEEILIDDLVKDLKRKAEWIKAHLRTNEWIQTDEGHGWFNGYYDNAGKALEGETEDGVRMTLTGQVFALMGDIATDEQAKDIVASCKKYLRDPSVAGYRLNTDFREVKLKYGRMFGFAFWT